MLYSKNRARWDYWYGPYIEWGFFIYLSALILLLLAICCPEWAYKTYNPWHLFMEIGLFKQCYAGPIYQKSLSDSFCAFSDSGNNQCKLLLVFSILFLHLSRYFDN